MLDVSMGSGGFRFLEDPIIEATEEDFFLSARFENSPSVSLADTIPAATGGGLLRIAAFALVAEAFVDGALVLGGSAAAGGAATGAICCCCCAAGTATSGI